MRVSKVDGDTLSSKYEEGDPLKLEYDLVFNEEIHETGELTVELCGTPEIVNP